jgi:hypothetical protein
MKNKNLPLQATKEELKKQKYKCWCSGCKNRAWLIDWAGYLWCFKHWYDHWRWGGGEVSIKSFLFYLINTRINL